MARWRPVVVLATAFLVVVSVSPAAPQSQATTGVIEGVVSDESGGSLADALVTLVNTQTNFTREITTDSDGRFRGLLLPLGTYKLTVSLAGFTTYVQDGLELAVGRTINVPVTLRLSSVQEAVTVEAAAPLIETTRAEQATLIDQQAVSGLPNNGRNFLAYMQLTPGVTIVQGPDGDEISVNGQKGINNNVSVDGADFNNPFFGEQRGGQRPPFTFNQDAIREIVVVADGAAAEFGRSGGGFVNVVTKSGTNTLAGSAHLFSKFDEMASANSAGEEFPFDQEQFGGTIGGPLRPDRFFYFLAYDEQRFRQTKQLNPDRIDPRLVDFFAGFGSPDENGPIRRTNDARAFLGKADYHLNASNLLSARYAYTWSRQENGTFDVDSWGRSANGLERDFSNAVSGSLNSVISGSMLNEFRFQFAREDRPRPYNGPNITGQSRPLPDTAMDFAGGFRFGMPFFLPIDYYDTRVQFTNNFSWIHGRHTFKVGGEFNRVNSVQTFIGFANGRSIFGSVDGFLNYVQFGPRYVECSNGTTSTSGACPAGATISGPLLLFLQQAGVGGLTVEEAGTQSIPQIEPSFFVQDKWQPTPTLTVQYGLRWEAQVQPDPITPPSEVFFAPFIGQPGFPSDGTIPSDMQMWQPRLGISWDASGNGRDVVRASAGIFYARIPGLNLASTRSTNGSRGQSLYRDSTFNGFGLTPPGWPDLIPASQVSSPDHPDVFVFDQNFQNPRSYSATVSYEREVIPNFSAFVSFTHSKTVHITRFINRNDPVFGSPWRTGLGADGQNGIAALTTVESSAKSKYDGVTFGMTKRFTRGYQFQWNYTLSRDKSDDDNERDPFTLRYARADNLAPEYSYSDRDQRHRFNAWLLTVFSGFEVNTRVSARSAQPQSVGNTPQDRIQPDGSIIQRNTLRKDNEFFTLDVRVARPFRLAQGMVVEPIFEVFNLTNSRNIRKPEVTNLIFNFDGTVQSGFGDPRQVQLGVRVRF
jgi:Carboxypeptidase regulatory-like domain/TonB-dependent Receptor Plug Domain